MKLNYRALPKIDDGSIYADITKFIKQEQFTIDIDTLLPMTDLQALIPGYTFEKVADCRLNLPEYFPGGRQHLVENLSFDGKLVDYIVLPEFSSKWKETQKEWVYTIVYDGKITKIGMTSSGLSSRFGSYNTGTKKAMRKGSCATTNFVITQCNYHALLKGRTVEIFAYEIPSVWTEEIIFGEKIQFLNKAAHIYETTLIAKYKEVTGNIPFLCGQS